MCLPVHSKIYQSVICVTECFLDAVSLTDSSLVGFSVVESPLVALSLALLALGYTVFLPTSAKRGTSASSVTVRSGGTWLKVLLFYTEAGDLWVLRCNQSDDTGNG